MELLVPISDTIFRSSAAFIPTKLASRSPLTSRSKSGSTLDHARSLIYPRCRFNSVYDDRRIIAYSLRLQLTERVRVASAEVLQTAHCGLPCYQHGLDRFSAKPRTLVSLEQQSHAESEYE